MLSVLLLSAEPIGLPGWKAMPICGSPPPAGGSVMLCRCRSRGMVRTSFSRLRRRRLPWRRARGRVNDELWHTFPVMGLVRTATARSWSSAAPVLLAAAGDFARC
jgi:hypothetical protein